MPQQLLFKGGGETGELIRQLDWPQTLLGPVETWPQSLLTAVNILMASRFPMMLHWGPELVHIYNDGYAKILQSKHPGALGQPAQPWWSEIWEFLAPIFDQVLAGETTYFENKLVLPNRQGFVEEAYFTFSHSPLYDDAGQVAGILATAIETTTTVVDQRRLAMLSHLASHSTAATTPEAALHQVAEALTTNPHDVPFALLYQLDTTGKAATLRGCAGPPSGTTLAPVRLPLTGPSTPGWPLANVVRTGEPLLVADLAAQVGPLPAGN